MEEGLGVVVVKVWDVVWEVYVALGIGVDILGGYVTEVDLVL